MFHGYWCFSYFACLSPSMSVMVALRLRGREGMTRAEALAIQGSDHPLRVEPREGFQGFRVPRRTVLLGSVPPMNDESAELGVDDGLALPGETSH